MYAGLDSHRQRLSHSNLRHFRRWRKALQRRREDRIGFDGASCGLIELRPSFPPASASSAALSVVGLGLDILFKRFPQILPVMRVAGSLYMLWLALKIALAKPIGEFEAGGRPIGFLAAAGFQWVNPKAWMIALSALAAYGGVVDDYTSSVLFIAALSALITVPCSGAWALFGLRSAACSWIRR